MQTGIRKSGAECNAADRGAEARRDETDSLRRLEFFVAQCAVLSAPYISFRHPDYYITISDCLFAIAFGLRISTERLSRPFGDVTWLWVFGVLLLVSGLLIGSFVNGDPLRGVIISSQYCFAYLLVPLTLLNRSPKQSISLIKCGVLGMVVMCAVGAAVYSSGYSSGYSGRHMSIVTGGRRLSGFADNANGMAVLTVLTVPLVWFLLLIGAMKKLTGIVCMALLVTAIVLTSSNTGIFGLIVATVIFFVGRRSFKTLILVSALGTGVLVWGQTYLPETFQKRVMTAVTSGDISEAGTFESRRAVAIEAISKARDHVVIGLGADQYRKESQYGIPVHNTYLLLLNEGGAWSLIGLLVIISTAVISVLIPNQRPYGNLVGLTVFTIAIVLASMLMGATHIYGRVWMLSLLLAIGPAVARRQANPNSAANSRIPLRGFRQARAIGTLA